MRLHDWKFNHDASDADENFAANALYALPVCGGCGPDLYPGDTRRRGINRAPQDEFYGDRSAGIRDRWNNQWWIATHIEDVDQKK